MSHPDQIKWDQRYKENQGKPQAACVLSDNQHLLPNGGTALELACGIGGNALFLAEHGFEVTAWDISPVAIELLQQHAREKNLPLKAEARDVTTQPPPANSFDVIVVSYFLERTLSHTIINALRNNGLLFYQTFSSTRLHDRGPRNPAFRLKENELLHMFKPLVVRYYREEASCGDTTQGLRDEACLVAQKIIDL